MKHQSHHAHHKYNKEFLKLGHDCELLAEEDAVEKKYPGSSLKAKIKRAWIRSILVNEIICKIRSLHLRSHGAIAKEKKRQLLEYPASIHPFSTMKFYWEMTMIMVIFILLICLSFDLAFYQFPLTAWFFSSVPFLIIRTLLDLICCVDIVVNAITGYYDEYRKEVVLDHKEIMKHYLKSKFLTDLLSAVPTHFDLIFPIGVESEKGNTTLLILQVFSIIKYGRFFTFVMYVKRIGKTCKFDFYALNAFLLFSTLLLFWLAISCLRVFGQVLISDPQYNHLYSNTTFYKAFCKTLYDGSLIIYTSSYGILEPDSNLDYILIDFFWFLSRFVQIYYLARVIETLQARTSSKMKYSQMVKQLTEFMRHKQLPIFTQKRILTYYRFQFQESYFRENEFNATISGQLRQEIMMQACRRLVEDVDFFRDLPTNLLIRIVTCLKSEIYLANDLILKANTVGNCMYFIMTGTVSVYTTSGKEVCHLYDGSHFGEIALVMDEKRVATVLAVETCELYRLDRKDFVKAVQPYPDLMDKIQKIARDRMEKTEMLDEYHKRESDWKK